MSFHRLDIRRGTTLAVLPLALALVSGCGGESDKKDAKGSAASSAPAATVSPAAAKNGVETLPADQILAKATKAMKDSGSFQIKGKGSEGGQAMTMNLQVRGSSVLADITMGKMALRIIRIGDEVYIKGDQAFYSSLGGAEVAKLLGAKYMKGSVNDKQLRDIASLADPDELLKPDGKVTKGEQSRVNGRPVIALLDGTQGKLYVATEGEPHVLAMDEGGNAGNRIDVTYDKTVEIKAPPADQTIDASKIGKGG
ncbi:hypothetical protein [Spirillospora sp. CA-294931]|uniref:hypothetical protein n=1 Tax=Spirillospora sp. CA-294931 TaxID=3240042 RepID=UPI003D8DEC42